ADPLAELFLYTADHADHLDRTIRPALARGDLVISDRYADSRYAYQGAGIAASASDRPEEASIEDPVAYVRSIHRPWTREPDLTLYFDVDAETGAERSGATNKFETAAFLESVRENYERLLSEDPERFVRIDATRPPEEVRSRAVEAIEAGASG
ncbi:MAG: dTMP kinase, partial [Halobacteriales archaeon]